VERPCTSLSVVVFGYGRRGVVSSGGMMIGVAGEVSLVQVES
jgi:hypothetical protein